MTSILEQESVKNTDTPVNKLIIIPLFMKVEGICMELPHPIDQVRLFGGFQVTLVFQVSRCFQTIFLLTN